MEALLTMELHCRVTIIDSLIDPIEHYLYGKKTLEWNADMVVMSSSIQDHKTCLRYATQIRAKNEKTIIIAAGQGPTAFPELFKFYNSPIDITITGEAELEIVSIVRKLKTGHDLTELRKCYPGSKMQIISDPDALPFPAWSNKELKKYYHLYPLKINHRLIWGHILSSRGCPHNCIFCSYTIRETYGKELRLRSSKNVVDEIETMIKRGVNVLIFDDDNFTTSKTHVVNICNELIKRRLNIPWTAHARIDEIDRDLILKMKEAGCILLRYGIESGSSRVLQKLKKTSCTNWPEKAIEISRFFKNADIGVVALFIIGNPGETREEIIESIELAKTMSPDILQVSFFTAYPGSTAYSAPGTSKTKHDFSRLYHYFAPEGGSNLSKLTTTELLKMYKHFYYAFFLNPKFVIRHFVKYSFFYFHNPHILYYLLRILRNFLTKKPETL